MGVAPLYKLQAGKETTWGTTVAATAIWYPTMLAGFRDPNAFVQPVERRGSLAPARRAYLPQQGAEGSIEAECTFEDVIFFLNMALKTGVITGASPYTHTFTPSTTAANTPISYSMEFGDDVQAFLVGGVLCKNLTLSGQLGQAIMAKADLFGKSIATTTFTAALTHRTQESALANKMTVFFDDTGGTIGTGANAKSDGTSVANSSLVSWEWRIPEHFYPQYHQAGALTPTTYGEKMFMPELDLVMAFKASVNTLRTKYAAGTRQLVRLRAAGSGSKTLTIDGAYTIVEDPLPFTERDGESLVNLKLRAEYDSTDALYCSIVVVNLVAALL